MHLVKQWKSEKNLSVLYDGQEHKDDDEGVDSQQEGRNNNPENAPGVIQPNLSFEYHNSFCS